MTTPRTRTRPARSALAAALICAVGALGLAGCSSAGAGSDQPSKAGSTPGAPSIAESTTDPADGADPADGGAISVVASTSVWGDIAAQVGGDLVDVTSLISDPSQDPHEFQPTARDELALSRADVVIANGGGYDDFVSQMLASAGVDPVVITATEVAGAPDSGATVDADNEHVWFNLDAAAAVARAVSAALETRDPAHGNDFRANADAFTASLDPIHAQLDAIRQQDGGADVLVTEPLPLYLVEDAGLTDVTPGAFAEAMEEGIDVSPADLSAVLDLIDGGSVRLLFYNEQTASAQVDQVLAAAKAANVPVLPLTETLPAGLHYQDWMTQVVTDLKAELTK